MKYALFLLCVIVAAAACPAGERIVERQRSVSKQTNHRGFFAGVRDRLQNRQRFSDRHRQRNFRLEVNNGHHGAQNFRLESNHHNRGELVLRLNDDHHSHGDVERFFLRYGDDGGRRVERQVVRSYVERQELEACDDQQTFRLDLDSGECRAFFKSH